MVDDRSDEDAGSRTTQWVVFEPNDEPMHEPMRCGRIYVDGLLCESESPVRGSFDILEIVDRPVAAKVEDTAVEAVVLMEISGDGDVPGTAESEGAFLFEEVPPGTYRAVWTIRHAFPAFRLVARRNEPEFFDEADALFGKRSEVGDSHDRPALLNGAIVGSPEGLQLVLGSDVVPVEGEARTSAFKWSRDNGSVVLPARARRTGDSKYIGETEKNIVDLVDASGELAAQGTIGSDGRIAFSGLPSGEYRSIVTLQYESPAFGVNKNQLYRVEIHDGSGDK